MATTPFKYQAPFPLGPDTTEYYLLTKDYVSVSEFEGTPVLKVEKEGLTAMANAAFRDVSFMLRRSHNEQVAKILSDPEASDNDKYVALTFLRNAEVAAKGVLPFCQDTGTAIIHGEKGHMSMMAYSKHTKILSMNGGFVTNAVCDSCTTVIPAAAGLKEKLEKELAETKLQEYRVTEENGKITIYAKGVPAHASTPTLGVNAAGVTFECLEKAGFEDDFVRFYNSHIGTACDGSGLDLKFQDAYGDLTLCNGIVKTENGEISCTIDIRFPVTLSTEQICTMCQNRLEDSDGYIEIQNLTEPLFFPRESPLVESLYKAYTDVTGDTANEPLVIGGGTYAKSLKNIIAFGPEKPGMDYHIHGADEFLLVPEMEEAVLIYMEAIKNLLAI